MYFVARGSCPLSTGQVTAVRNWSGGEDDGDVDDGGNGVKKTSAFNFMFIPITPEISCVLGGEFWWKKGRTASRGESLLNTIATPVAAAVAAAAQTQVTFDACSAV